MKKHLPKLKVHRIGIDTYNQNIAFLRSDCEICRAEGFELPSRIKVLSRDRSIICSLNMVTPNLLPPQTIGLSEFAWQLLSAEEDGWVTLEHQSPIESLSYVRAKIYGRRLQAEELRAIIKDITLGSYADTQISAFITAFANNNLVEDEIYDLTMAMLNVGQRLSLNKGLVVDKHSIGGLPGNRTTMLVVPIVAAFGLTIPKTSSRAITSPSGTADTMEVLAPVQLNLEKMRAVVEQENGCIVWGGSAALSPADDILIQVERVLNLDNEAQLVASVLSKKLAVGSTHVLVDIPVGSTAKVRSIEAADQMKQLFLNIAKKVGITLDVMISDGSEPIGRGIGPVLEALDVLAVLKNNKNAPMNLRERALVLAGKILELAPNVKPNIGKQIATEILDSGKACRKFQAICHAQGGFFEPKLAPFRKTIVSERTGIIVGINNRRLAMVAKLAGAPRAKSAGLELLVMVGNHIIVGQPLFVIHAESPGALEYSTSAMRSVHEIILIE